MTLHIEFIKEKIEEIGKSSDEVFNALIDLIEKNVQSIINGCYPVAERKSKKGNKMSIYKIDFREGQHENKMYEILCEETRNIFNNLEVNNPYLQQEVVITLSRDINNDNFNEISNNIINFLKDYIREELYEKYMDKGTKH
jgi:hypothetical protein